MNCAKSGNDTQHLSMFPSHNCSVITNLTAVNMVCPFPGWFNEITNLCSLAPNLSGLIPLKIVPLTVYPVLYSVNLAMITDLKTVPNYSILINTTWAMFFCLIVYRSSPSPSSTTTLTEDLLCSRCDWWTPQATGGARIWTHKALFHGSSS